MPHPALDLDKLTRDEKLQLIEEIWDSLDADANDLPLSDGQRRDLDRRLDEIDREGPTGIPWEQVMQELQSRLK
ncbi:MAG TPA: addiction module protein [Candidatus Polarisedimenticolaceae bacterium]|nr:addiction module protein [Candidatus Polarisedimenticolaceae bacterium]